MKNYKKFGVILLLFGASIFTTQVFSQNEVTVKGEIVDMACYVANGSKGADHADCAKACVKGGQPMGLLTDDGTLVLLAADHKDGQAYDKLKDHAGENAEVTGKKTERDGVKMITVSKARALK